MVAAIKEEIELSGYKIHLEKLLKDDFFGKRCPVGEAEQMFKPTNHGYNLCELYPEFADDE